MTILTFYVIYGYWQVINGGLPCTERVDYSKCGECAAVMRCNDFFSS